MTYSPDLSSRSRFSLSDACSKLLTLLAHSFLPKLVAMMRRFPTIFAQKEMKASLYIIQAKLALCREDRRADGKSKESDRQTMGSWWTDDALMMKRRWTEDGKRWTDDELMMKRRWTDDGKLLNRRWTNDAETMDKRCTLVRNAI